MAKGKQAKNRNSAFAEVGLQHVLDQLCDEIRELYLSDEVPWVIGYSGGKDSTAVLQLVWMALEYMPEKELNTSYAIVAG